MILIAMLVSLKILSIHYKCWNALIYVVLMLSVQFQMVPIKCHNSEGNKCDMLNIKFGVLVQDSAQQYFSFPEGLKRFECVLAVVYIKSKVKFPAL